MQISRERFGRIIREEFIRFIKEAEENETDIADAEQDSNGKGAPIAADPKTPVKPQPKGGQASASPKEDPKPDPTAKGEELAAVEDEADVTGGKISSTVVGKTIQSISLEPKSKILPGAKELVITFDQLTDPLRVLITSRGEIKFFFRGIHNEL